MYVLTVKNEEPSFNGAILAAKNERQQIGGRHKYSKYVQYVPVKIALKLERTMNELRS